MLKLVIWRVGLQAKISDLRRTSYISQLGIALFIDFEKAFDSLEWDFLRKTLDTSQTKTTPFQGIINFVEKLVLSLPLPSFFGLISAIPGKWKQTLKSGINLNSEQTKKTDQSFLNKGSTCKSIRNLLTQNKFREPLASSRLCRLGIEYDKFLYISQNFIMARLAAFVRSKLHQILKTASISPQCLTYAFVSFSLSLCLVFY